MSRVCIRIYIRLQTCPGLSNSFLKIKISAKKFSKKLVKSSELGSDMPRHLISFQNLLCLTPLIWQNFCACIIEDNKNGIRRFKWLKNRIMNLRMPFLGYVFENRVNPGRFLTLLLCMHKNSVKWEESNAVSFEMWSRVWAPLTLDKSRHLSEGLFGSQSDFRLPILKVCRFLILFWQLVHVS